MPTRLRPEIINAAILGFEQQKARIDDQIAELRAMLDGGTKPIPAATPEATTAKRKISAAARRRMALGQQKRWAAIKGTTESPSQAATPEPVKPKRKLSAAGKANIVAALKKRWAAKKAAAAKAAPAKAKKATLKKSTPLKAAKKTAAKNAPVNVAAKASE
jgi:hypothetical protein